MSDQEKSEEKEVMLDADANQEESN